MKASATTIPGQGLLIKPFWTDHFGPPWVVALLTLSLIAVLRSVAILSPFPLQELFFLQTIATWAMPLAMLTPSGRRQIGLVDRGFTSISIMSGIFVGALCAIGFFLIGLVLYGDTANSWCMSIRNYLHLEQMRGLMSPLALFSIYALPAISLQPVGEEILFRGFIQETVARRFNSTLAMLANSLLFALMYLSLHGIWKDAAGYHLRTASVLVALTLMTLIGIVFNLCRFLSGSLWAAVTAHAAFSLTLLAMAIHRYLQ